MENYMDEKESEEDAFDRFITTKINQLNEIKDKSKSKTRRQNINPKLSNQYSSPKTAYKLRTLHNEINKRVITDVDYTSVIKKVNKGCGCIRFNRYDVDKFLKSTNSFLIRSYSIRNYRFNDLKF